MRIFELPSDPSPRIRGRAHGEAFRGEIAEIAAIRSELCQSQALFRSDAELLQVAELHLPVLARFDPDLHDELLGIAEGAGLPAARLVVLNHYTDLKDLDPSSVLGAAPRVRDVDKEEDCSAIAWATPEGPVLAQTWDMHGSAKPYVVMLRVPSRMKRREGREVEVPEAWMLSITGCLGMAGMNSVGVGLTINNLKSGDARVGLVWPALVRRALEEATAAAARDVVTSAPLGSGHHYLTADKTRAYGIETSGTLAEIWADADMTKIGEGFHHENHCLGTEVAKVSSISPVSTTLLRHAFLETSLKGDAVKGVSDLWSRLGSHEGAPRGVCTHLASPEAPHAMETCAGILMRLGEGRVFAKEGCIHNTSPTEFLFAQSPR